MSRPDSSIAAAASRSQRRNVMSFETILFERREPVGLLTLNRPQRLNAFNGKMIDEIGGLMDSVEGDDGIRALVVAGAGRAFSAGFDLKESADRPWSTIGEVAPVLKKDFEFIMRFWHFAKPTIAAVHGHAIAGACELALACDITIAAEGTLFGEPELRFGSGMVALLMPWFAGPKKAKEFLLTGNDKIDAADALCCGLVNRVVPPGRHVETALAIADEIAANNHLKVAMTKRALNRTYEMMGMLAALDMGLDVDIQLEALDTPGGRTFREIRRREGLKAALAWRDSRFSRSAR
jgi:enoyl-CoA hydratase/carnithine racemase